MPDASLKVMAAASSSRGSDAAPSSGVPFSTSQNQPANDTDLDQRATNSEACVAAGAIESDSSTIETHP
jgi:hypothetical protein